MRRTTTKTAKYQKTSSRAVSHEGRDHVHVSSARFRAEQEDKSRRLRTIHATPRQGGDQLSPCLHKAAQWLLATPLKIGWTVQGARGGRQLPPPTPVDRCHYSMKTMSTEECQDYNFPPSLAVCGNPFPKIVGGMTPGRVKRLERYKVYS
jgi:hypothetical protein